MTGGQLRRRRRLRWLRWLLIRWGVAAGIVCGCFLFIYPRQLINDSPDILALLETVQAGQGALPMLAPLFGLLSRTLRWLLVWLPDREALPLLYPTFAPYIDPPAVEYAWLMFLAVCMAAGVGGSFLIMLLWRFFSRLGIRAARRARRAFWLFFIAAALVILLNTGLGALVFLFWSSGREMAAASVWGWVMHLGVFVAVPVVAILSAWRAAPARIGGRGCFFR